MNFMGFNFIVAPEGSLPPGVLGVAWSLPPDHPNFDPKKHAVVIKQQMRTQQEIIDKMKAVEDNDFFCTIRSDLLNYLDYPNAKPFLKPEATEEEWNKAKSTLTRENVLKEMLDYMPFAWDKANNFRGLSAGRSMDHYTAWVWLLGDEDVAAIGDLKGYEFYGKDNLVKLCQRYGWDAKQWDDGVRKNSE